MQLRVRGVRAGAGDEEQTRGDQREPGRDGAVRADEPGGAFGERRAREERPGERQEGEARCSRISTAATTPW
ncbi:hypothetical protein GTY65_05160 [Streptomyces sp. SID8379]|uniref:hypothetical protein n=1 Tax=unclassified Streptomyces TaxID=2593676 RepID=UPI001319FCD1|nr:MULTISPECIES: hypothetical protein [unclassified Streptomyces]MYW63469.1 hypothetical protein [Streptomyces sp. SID8379]